MAVGLFLLFLFCETEDPIALSSPLTDSPCVFPVETTDGIGTAVVNIDMHKRKIDQSLQLYSIDTLNDRFYYNYNDNCDDTYAIEYTDTNTVRSIAIKSPRIKCRSNITVGKTKKEIEDVYGPAFITQVYQTLNALHYDIEGIIFFVDDSTGLESVKILPPVELLHVKSGYGSEEINIYSTKNSILSLEYDSIFFTTTDTYEHINLIYENRVYGIWFPDDTTLSRIAFGSKIICDSIITKRSTENEVKDIYGLPDTQMQFESLKQHVYCYIRRGVDFVFDTCGYVVQTVIYPVR